LSRTLAAAQLGGGQQWNATVLGQQIGDDLVQGRGAAGLIVGSRSSVHIERRPGWFGTVLAGSASSPVRGDPIWCWSKIWSRFLRIGSFTRPSKIVSSPFCDLVKINKRVQISPLTWVFVQGQRACCGRRDDRIRTCDPLTPRSSTKDSCCSTSIFASAYRR
jgi:hypothetical protein